LKLTKQKQPTTMNLEGQRRVLTNFCAPVGQQFITLLNVKGEVVSDTNDGIVFELDEKDRGRLPDWTHGRVQFTEHDAKSENHETARDLFLERTRKV
jgi:hypothetical protein